MRLGRLLTTFIAAALVLPAAPVFANSPELSDPTIGILRLQGDLSAVSNSPQFGYVILNAWEADRIPDLKAANPNVKVLVYKEMSAVVDYATDGAKDLALLPAGVGYNYADDNHPDWFLKDMAGKRLNFCDYPGAWWMDIGNAEYQNTWTANVGEELAREGWDGVMLDDTMASPWAHLCGRTISKYPNDPAYRAATDSFLASVGPALKAQGHLVMPNISDADLATWNRWVGFSSGAVREWWTKAGVQEGVGYFGNHDWDFLMSELEATEKAGKAFVGITYSPMTDLRAMRYARASFLLGYQGGPSAIIFHPGGGVDSWSTKWTASVGDPLGARYKAEGAWVREFSNGIVVVNSSTQGSTTVSLPREYVNEEGKAVTSLTLQPTSAAILTTGQSVPPDPGPTPEPSPTTDPVPTPEPSPTTDPSPTPEPSPTTDPGPTPDPDPDTALPIKLQKKKRPKSPRRVVLTWRGADSPRIDVFRNGRLLDRHRNDGHFRDRPRARRASRVVRYRICEAQTHHCSNKLYTKVRRARH